jgi:hypothetical protein
MIVGVKGTGKTKTLISMVNAATELSAGAVVCLEKGTNLRFNVKYQARLINVDEYALSDAQSLYGFIAGVYASNQDITHIFVDGNNILNQFSPGLRMFSGTLTNYAMEFLDPYLAAFTNNGTNNLNTKAATQFMKEETNKKIEEFMKRFEEASGRDEM